MNKEEAIQYIQQQIDKIDIDKFTIGPDRDKDFNVWKKEMLLCVGDIYGESSQRYYNVKAINYGTRYIVNTHINDITSKRREGLEEAKLLLEGYIENIKKYGLPHSTNIYSDNKQQLEQPQVITNIHNNNNQTQEVNISIIVQNIFEGLNNSEREELKKVLIQYDKDRNKKNLISSLQSMGKGVVENIIANLITNPRFIGQIIQTLS